MISRSEFKLNKLDKMRYYTIPSFEKTGLVKHVFTTRDLNLGFNTIDDDKKITDNFKTICKVLDIKIEDSVLSDQVHKTGIKVVTLDDKGKGLQNPKDYEEIDGLVTDQSGIALFTFYADCVPMFFLDKEKKVAGVAHGGWRGTVGKIAAKMLDTMSSEYGSDPKDILGAIGPSIGSCCYERNKDVYDKFNKYFVDIDEITNQVDDKWSLDLKKANKIILEDKDVPTENITISQLCTSCNNDMFFSYRKEDGKTGRMSAAIVLV